MALTHFPHGISSMGIPILGVGQDISGITYFVDGNFGRDGEKGLSWDKPFKTLARALVISHANIGAGAKGWAARNTIYVKGDWLVENLVLGCQKTDIIGVGSCDGFKGAGITGNHALATTTAVGTRWININFRPKTAADIFTLITITQAMEFHGCRFHGAAPEGIYAVSAIDATASNFLKVVDCDFTGDFSGDVIDLGPGAIDDLRIIRNTISGAANDGIIVTDTTTVTGGRKGVIADNLICVAGVTINDGADSTIYVMNNRCITDASDGSSAYVITDDHAINNMINANGTIVMKPEWTVEAT